MWYDFYRPGCSDVCQSPIGSNRILCFFDCPTSLEVSKKMPVMGIAGANFCLLLRILRATPGPLSNKYGSELYRRRVGIFNTAEMDGKVVCVDKKLVDVDDKLILCFGDKAEQRLQKYEIRQQINVYHTGELGLMHIRFQDEICECLRIPVAMRGMARLFVIAEYITRRYEAITHLGDRIGKFADFVNQFDISDYDLFENLLSHVRKANFRMIFSHECSFDCCRKCENCKLTERWV